MEMLLHVERWSALAVAVVPCVLAATLVVGLRVNRRSRIGTPRLWIGGGLALGLWAAVECRGSGGPAWLNTAALASTAIAALMFANPSGRWGRRIARLVSSWPSLAVAAAMAAVLLAGSGVLADGAVGALLGVWAGVPLVALVPVRWSMNPFARRWRSVCLVSGPFLGLTAALELQRVGVELADAWPVAVGAVAGGMGALLLRSADRSRAWQVFLSFPRRAVSDALIRRVLLGAVAGVSVALLASGSRGWIPAFILVMAVTALVPASEFQGESLQGHPRRWWTLAALAIPLVLVTADNTIFNVALPSMQRDINASASELSWIVDSYSLCFASMLLTLAVLGDRFGRRLALLTGLALFAGGACAALFSDSVGSLVLARVVMGFGAACMFPTTLSELKVVFRDTELPKVTAVWAAISGVGVAIGPVVGGWLIESFDWHAVFTIAIPLSAVGFLAAVRLVPESRVHKSARLDLPGAGLSVAAVFSILWAITEAPSRGWSNREIVVTLVLGAVALGAFLSWELKAKSPLLDLTLLRKPGFVAPASAIALMFFGLLGSLYVLAPYLQVLLGYSPLRAGVGVLPVAPGIAVMSLLAPKVVNLIGRRWTIAAGLSVIAGGMVALSTATASSGYLLIGFSIFVTGVGMGTATAPSTASVMESLGERSAMGAAMNETTRQFGAAFGIAIMATVLRIVYSHRMAGTRLLPRARAHGASDNVSAAYQVAAGLPDRAGVMLQAAARDAFLAGMAVGLRVAAGVTLMGGVLAVVLLSRGTRRPHVSAVHAIARDAVGKPKWRGIVHHYAGFLAAGPMACLVLSAGSSVARVAALIFAVGGVGSFAISGVYHRFDWPPAARLRWRKADHAMVYLTIASGWTPVLLVDDGARWITLVVWAAALAGALSTVFAIQHTWVGIVLYVGLGWGPAPALFGVGTTVGKSAVTLMLVAGVVYTLGGIAYSTRTPKGWPTVWGYHEFAHVAYVAAFALQAIAIARWIVPRL